MTKTYVVVDAKRLELTEAALQAVRWDMFWELPATRQAVIDAFSDLAAFEEYDP